MAIGSSDGQMYETPYDVEINRPITKEANAMGKEGGPPYHPPEWIGNKNYGWLFDWMDAHPEYDQHEGQVGGFQMLNPDNHPPSDLNPKARENEGALIDRNHHVPLVASALTDDKGQIYGMAIDHRIPPNPEYEKHLFQHEAYENAYMNDLVKNGYSSQDAYHKAHDWATGRESEAVKSEFGEEGLDQYKKYWRNAATVAAEPTERARHPDAHTTRHRLDESELGGEFKTAGDVIDMRKSFMEQQITNGLIRDIKRGEGKGQPAPVLPISPSSKRNNPAFQMSENEEKFGRSPVEGKTLEEQLKDMGAKTPYEKALEELYETVKKMKS